MEDRGRGACGPVTCVVEDGSSLMQRGGGVKDGEPGVGVPAGLLAPTCAGGFKQCFRSSTADTGAVQADIFIVSSSLQGPNVLRVYQEHSAV